jgi:hypothetical protein
MGSTTTHHPGTKDRNTHINKIYFRIRPGTRSRPQSRSIGGRRNKMKNLKDWYKSTGQEIGKKLHLFLKIERMCNAFTDGRRS